MVLRFPDQAVDPVAHVDGEGVYLERPARPLLETTLFACDGIRVSKTWEDVQPKLGLPRDSGVDDAAIWRKHKEELIRYATVLVGVDHAEDVLSIVVERVLRRKGSLAALDDARPYLFQAVLNESRGLLRRQRVIPWERDFVEDHVEFRPDVAAAVGSLPERQRAAVYLTYWRDLPVSEVAALMGCRPGTIKRYLHLSRSRLRKVLEP